MTEEELKQQFEDLAAAIKLQESSENKQKIIARHGGIDCFDERRKYNLLFLAVSCEEIDVVRFLVENNADLDQKNYHNLIPLEYASAKQNEEIATYLLGKTTDGISKLETFLEHMLMINLKHNLNYQEELRAPDNPREDTLNKRLNLSKYVDRSSQAIVFLQEIIDNKTQQTTPVLDVGLAAELKPKTALKTLKTPQTAPLSKIMLGGQGG